MPKRKMARDRRRNLHARLDRLLALQHGVVSRAQALEAGASAGSIAHLLDSGRWCRLHRGIYRSAAAPVTFEQRAMAACMAITQNGGLAAVTGIAAGRLHELDGTVNYQPRCMKDSGPLFEIIATRRARLDGIVVRKNALLAEEHVTTVARVPVTSVPQTIVDIAGRYPRWIADRALDDALRRRPEYLAEVESCARKIAGRGRQSVRTVLALLETRQVEDGHTQSRLEQKVLRIIRSAGLPRPAAQHAVWVGDREYHIDLAYPHVRLGIEVDGFEFHKGRTAFDVDRQRANRLLNAGWTLLRVTSGMPAEEIVDTVRQGLMVAEGTVVRRRSVAGPAAARVGL